MIKVVIMIPSPLTERWECMFCIDALSQRFDLEYWDCSKICRPAFESSSTLQRDYVWTISDMKYMEKQLSRLPKDTVVISHIHMEGFNYKLHKMISGYVKNRVFINFWSNSISVYINAINTNQASISEQSKASFGRRVIKKTKSVIKRIRPLFYFAKFIEYKGGDEYYAFRDENRRECRYMKAAALYNHFNITVIPGREYSINHPDYEKYLDIIQNKENLLVDDRYVVFLDQNFPNHPTLRSENPDVDFKALAQPYYNSLNSFFDKIEAQYKCKVVIAGHPIANYQNNPFGGRQIFYYKTAELVSSSFAVLLHNSYSVSYPILFDKPICIIANAALLHATEIRNNLKRFSIVFKKEIVNTDIVDNVVNVFYPVETEIREQYINTFFDTSVKEKNEAILTRHIEKIHSVILNNCLACNRNNS